MLYPQNGDRIMVVYFVTSFNPMYTVVKLLKVSKSQISSGATLSQVTWRLRQATGIYGELSVILVSGASYMAGSLPLKNDVTQLPQSRRQVHDVLSAAESVPPMSDSEVTSLAVP